MKLPRSRREALFLAFLLFLTSPSRSFAAEAPPPLPPLREPNATRQAWLQARLERVLPQLMRRHGVSMWIVVCREYNVDPVRYSNGPQDRECRKSFISTASPPHRAAEKFPR